ncbi:hypothetical protein [Aurantiacibacter flavus]|uniref:CRISPR type III-B/RAMP module-associated protein Cmr5 n=1 Tax=Aurantiacibacter flavus TaxID=3145232 RepID=A0ABV0CWF3_9SPHN
MRNVNHTRPQLRLMDNMRRELGKIPDNPAKPKVDETWPPYLRPVVLRKDAHLALSKLFQAIDAWSDSEGPISFSDFPEQLRNAVRAFADVRVHHDYDNQYRGRNWVADLRRSENDQARAWGEFLASFVTTESGQS